MEDRQDQDRVWRALVQRQAPQVERYACREYLEGLSVLNLAPDHVPSMADLNAIITPRTGWRLQRTPVRYSDALPWYRHFARKIFLVTNYMRCWEELDFTPEPDMFHDIFGHLPFLVLPPYAALVELFAPAFLRTDGEHREHIKRLAWFTTEFGLVRQDGQRKVFGAGLLSSAGEIRQVMEGRTPILPFSVEKVVGRSKAIYNFNEALFEFESMDALADELRAYFASIPSSVDPVLPLVEEHGAGLADWELADLKTSADPPD